MPRHFLIACAALSLAACGGTSIQPYPDIWPPLTGMSSDCREVQGLYVDPNAWAWERRGKAVKGEPGAGGTLDAAWIALGFTGQGAPGAGRREFTLAFDGADTLVMEYLINGKTAAVKRLGRDKWSCGADGLRVVTLELSGAVIDKVPSHGSAQRSATLYRVGDSLYSRTIDSSDIKLLHALPRHSLKEQWQRFPASAAFIPR
ncbi:hypothetical protein [Pseudoduganella namucuonensis]|uniref:Lipoprotein n=1 Tax=Pseudoduganella namucuonensis TaxID=1035707 RepID=A0A1I7KZM4_9BURK|nr:hypothetical protein [Pseudoduganella namucuonensis]SFV02754.1 hypothetical protein SAMN05216552_102158 [Pseudoduganella namucuonensis]